MLEHSQQTLQLFAQIGARLKSAREQRGFTLRELSSHTRINAAFLEKIESGDLQGLPGLAFVKGFIRNYISVLEIKDEELDQALQELAPPGGREAQNQLTPSNPQVLDTETARPSLLRLALLGVLAVLILWVGYVLFRGTGTPQPGAPVTPSAIVTPETSPAGAPSPIAPAGSPPSAPASTVPAAPAATAAPQPPAAAPAAAAPAPPPAQTPRTPQAGTRRPATGSRQSGPIEGRQKLELTIRGLERTWVRLSLDRAPPVDVLMQPAETVAWEANQEIRLTVGRSNGVAIYLNGEEVVLPSEPNRLIPNLVLNKLTLLRLEN